jgi:MFS family permease
LHARFLSNLLLAAAGAALAALARTTAEPTAAWIALGVGAAAFLLAFACLPALSRGAAQRGLDVVTMLVGAGAVVVARAFHGDVLTWSVFGAGCGLALLGVAGLALYERDEQRLVAQLLGSDGQDAPPSRPPGPPVLNAIQEPPEGPHRRRGPLALSYWSAALLVIFALIPYLVLATSVGALGPLISHDVGLSSQALSLTNGMSNAAYAACTVFALALTVHFHGRRLLVGYALVFVLGSVAAAWAPTPGFFIAGRILQGAMTGLMLIAAVPPLVVGWPARRLQTTAVIMNMGIFGAVALGPVIGGTVANAGGDAWRTLFWVVCGLGGGAFLFSLLTFYDQEPIFPQAPWSPGALLSAAAGCGLTFFGSAELTSHPFVSTWVLLPLVAGIVLITGLVIEQYQSRRPLMPIREMASTFPVVGIIVAITAGASSVAIIELVSGALAAKGATPGHIGTLFWPEFGGALLAAAIFGALFHTKWIKIIALTGLVCVAVSAAILTGVSSAGDSIVWIGTGVLGFGVGASVAPALFVAGFSLPSNNIARIFALIELLRAVAAFSVGPILVHLAMTTGGSPATGTRTALWISMGIAAAGAVAAVYLFVLARARPHHPKIERWIAGNAPAFDSPALAAALRGLDPDPTTGSESPAPAGVLDDGLGRGNGDNGRQDASALTL